MNSTWMTHASWAKTVVARKTKGVRLGVIRTEEGQPAISEFEAYHDPLGEPYNQVPPPRPKK